MSWSFRKKVKILPGVDLNLSKSGVGVSVGPKGAKISVGKKGAYLNTSIPGTGLYKRTKLSLLNWKSVTISLLIVGTFFGVSYFLF